MTRALEHSLTTLATAAVTGLTMYGFGVQPATSAKNTAVAESTEYAANSQMIRDQLELCLVDLKACWRDCGN